jgi:beta-glucosidase-like glycosyl hydrolase/serine/threonine protein kinase
MLLTKGTSFAGFIIVEPLGSGSTGETYVAEHPTTHGHYFLKILSNEISADAEFRERFNREERIVVKLDHHSILRVHRRGLHRGRLWTVMDYVEGSDLTHELQQQYPAGMPLRRGLRVVRPVASALDYAHHRGMLHRAVKPSNILLSEVEPGKRRILLADFGLAVPLHGANGLAATNMTPGTIDYAAPEQLRGEALDEAADQYALAATTFYLLTGSQPRARDRGRDLGAVNAVLARALSEDPNDRFDSCKQFAEALADVGDRQRGVTTAAITADHSKPDHTQSAPRRTQRHHLPARFRPRRPRRMVISIVAAFFAVALVAGGIFIGIRLGVNRHPVATSMTPSRAPAPAPAPGAPPPSSACGDPNAILRSMTPREKLAQLLMVGVTGADDARAVVANQRVGGIFIGSWTNLSMLSDGSLTKITESAGPLGLAVSVDEEGGRVDRLASLIGPAPSARSLAASSSPDDVYQLAKQRGLAMKNLGITVDFAPVVDVSDQPADAVIGDRSFSNDPATVTTYAGAYARGLRDAGLLPVLKHFPGHGHGSGDSHTGSVVTPPLDQLEKVDLVPYRTLLNQGRVAVMVGHLQVPGLTGDLPASLSPAAIELLRTGGYGGPKFDGPVFTDDLSSMQAISDRYSVPQAVLMALQAGADTALWVTTAEVPAVLDRLEAAVNAGDLRMDAVDQKVQRVAAANMANGRCGR